MVHIEINKDGWERLEGLCHFHSVENISNQIGIAAVIVDGVINGGQRPDGEFVAACLWHLPASFGQLFSVASAAA